MVLDEHRYHFFRDEDLADVIKSEGHHICQSAQAAAASTDAAGIMARARK